MPHFTNRIGFRNVVLVKDRHSQAYKKHYIIQVSGYRHWGKNTCSNT